MDVKLTSIDSMKPNYRGSYIEADIEFYEEHKVIEAFGAKKCVEALVGDGKEHDVYDALGGWGNAKDFFSEEIDELLAEKDAEIQRLKDVINDRDD